MEVLQRTVDKYLNFVYLELKRNLDKMNVVIKIVVLRRMGPFMYITTRVYFRQPLECLTEILKSFLVDVEKIINIEIKETDLKHGLKSIIR